MPERASMSPKQSLLQEQWKLDRKLSYKRGVFYAKLLEKNGLCIRGKLILDAGCGQGGISAAFRTSGNTVIGIDLTNKNAQILCDVNALPFKHGVFDLVLALSIVEHVREQKKFAKEIEYVLKKKGKAIIQTPNRLFPIDPHYQLPFLYYLPRRVAKVYLRFARNHNYDLYPLCQRDLYRLFTSFDFLLSESYWYPFWMLSKPFRVWYSILRTAIGRFLSPALLFVFQKS